jgi:hypothetical protein
MRLPVSDVLGAVLQAQQESARPIVTIPAEPWTTFRRLGFHENAVARDHAAAVRPPPSCVSLAGQVSTRAYVNRVIVTETSARGPLGVPWSSTSSTSCRSSGHYFP